MKTDTKLAQVLGTFNRLQLGEVVNSARRVLETRQGRVFRPLRDIDGWSNQAEVAFYEEHGVRNA